MSAPAAPTTTVVGAAGSGAPSSTTPWSERPSRENDPYEAQEPNRGEITLAAGKAWFGAQRVLAFAASDDRGRDVRWYAQSVGGGTKSPAADGPSRLETLVVPAGMSPERDPEHPILAAGGLQLFQAVNDEPIILGRDWGEKVVVRGQAASLFEAGTLYGGGTVCNVSWSEPGEDGHFLGYLMRTRLEECKDRRAVAIANRLVVA